MAASPSESNSKFCTSSDGTLIYAEASGTPTNPSIVFAHGFALSGIVFDRLFADERMLGALYLASIIACFIHMHNSLLVRYDVRGHGRSGKPTTPEGYASALYAADFAAVVEGFGLHMPVFVGWSAGAPIISDICTHISPVPLRGAIAMSGALCVATSANTLKPKLIDLFRRMHVSDNAHTAFTTRTEFVDACFKHPEDVPFNIKAAWVGCTVLQTPDIVSAIDTGHRPDQGRLVELGREGLPVMVLYGTADELQDGEVVAEDAGRYFRDLEVVAVEGGSHAVFYDEVDETVGRIVGFCERVNR
ncbi:AB hydrolase-1 domain-containing protein [Favolaschia claudopus]|uniref:AB hydrolase-1 domain-containing protein n=1 Tax=Favolaschia claudopus TaxID=2862362 RepID=A0AAW0E4I7_9AGAR